MDTITIKKNNQTYIKLGARCILGYDNFSWWQLDLLIKILKDNSFESKEALLKEIEEKTSFFEADYDYNGEVIIDLDNNTINNQYFPLFLPEEVSQDNCCIDLKIVDGKYYSVYEDGSEFPMPYVSFKDVDLLKKETYTFEEFAKVADFVNGLVDEYNDTDFVLNNKLIVRFNFA